MYNLHKDVVEVADMNRVRELRKRNGWLQADLAVRLNTTQQSVARYESEGRGLDVETIHKLCDIFGCTADYLLGRSEQPAPDLSEEEWRLVAAFREADPDARAMVRLALKRWLPAETETKNAAS